MSRARAKPSENGRAAGKLRARAGEGELRDLEASRRSEILRAAIEVFAGKGYHGCRIADVAKHAGVAYGLVYHYFKNKEELLESVFQASFGRFAKAIDQLAEADVPPVELLERIVDFAFDAFLTDPKAIKVLIFEIVRSPAFREAAHVSAMQHTMEATATIIARGQKHGELRDDVAPFLAASMLFGAVETALTTLVLGHGAASTAEGVGKVKRDLLAIFLAGMAPRAHARARDGVERRPVAR